MKKIILCCLLTSVMCIPTLLAQNDLSDLFGTFMEATGGSTGLSDGTIVEGLVEALKVGSNNAITSVSLTDGYLGNDLIKIQLPENIQQIESIIRLTGYGDNLDAFVVSMNRAAEKAAPEAKALFMDAIKGMTFTDARRILKGRDNEATLYFREKTEAKLFTVFEPVVDSTLAEVGVTREYQELEKILTTLPIKELNEFKLNEYVTGKALDGLFEVVAQEEKKIRENPEARVSDILKKVFGS